jgi:hypothetical protein
MHTVSSLKAKKKRPSYPKRKINIIETKLTMVNVQERGSLIAVQTLKGVLLKGICLVRKIEQP